MWQSIRAAVAGPFQWVLLVVHTPCWTSSVLFSLGIAKAITTRRNPERQRQRERRRDKAEAATEKRFSENKLKIFGTWFDVWCPCTHTHSDLHMRVCVCVCLCAMFVLPVGICSDFELLLCFAWQQRLHRQHFCNRCQRRVVCFLTCFAVGCAHVLIDYMSAAQDREGDGSKGGSWLPNVADNCSWSSRNSWSGHGHTMYVHMLAYSHIYRVYIEYSSNQHLVQLPAICS